MANITTQSINLGFPRIGANRELKRAQEQFWAKKITEEELLQIAQGLRKRHWLAQKSSGIHSIPVNDFSLYDHVLDMSNLFGLIPERFKGLGDSLTTYFAMARGITQNGKTIAALEMTKWFDTNYHYLVPEFDSQTSFSLSSNKIIQEWKEAQELGISSHVVLLGPVSFLALGKTPGQDNNFDRFSLIHDLAAEYTKLFKQLKESGIERVQIDEPILALDSAKELHPLFECYNKFADPGFEIVLATYFDSVMDNIELLASLPVDVLHIDATRYPYTVEELRSIVESGKKISLGIIDGRNIWRANLNACMDYLDGFVQSFGKEKILVGPSCSLLHSPVDCINETSFDEELLSWLAFAHQKLDEIATLTQGINEGRQSIHAELQHNATVIKNKTQSSRINRPRVKQAMADITDSMQTRSLPYNERKELQKEKLLLPLFPTTTIGSFPQTPEVRKLRSDFRKQHISKTDYEAALRKEIESTIRFQEDIDLDVLVHGEAERNDMVEYFGEQLEGFTVSTNGWVQSYGSRCVKPPIIYGDLERKQPMTVDWISYAQSLSKKHVKGMLTGPVTILQWSFVRDDQARSDTALQLALAIRDEVNDIEAAGIQIIQVDEPAFREGMPLQRKNQEAYIKWATKAFRISTAGVKNNTQIHTHMCYSEFNDSIHAIAQLDADVISLETSRSNMEILDSFVDFRYPNAIGPGIYDIHSPNIPSPDDMLALLQKILKVLEPEQLWINPDCGLKTRAWKEVDPSLRNMVLAAKKLRTQYQK